MQALMTLQAIQGLVVLIFAHKIPEILKVLNLYSVSKTDLISKVHKIFIWLESLIFLYFFV